MYSVFLVLPKTTLQEGEGEMVIQLAMVSIFVRLGAKKNIFVKWRLNRLHPSLKLFLTRQLRIHLMYTTIFLLSEGQPRALNFTPSTLADIEREGKWDSTEASYNSLYLTF